MAMFNIRISLFLAFLSLVVGFFLCATSPDYVVIGIGFCIIAICVANVTLVRFLRSLSNQKHS